jgi:DNA-binding transcriptional regulator YhcF (GntR family)
MKKKKSSPKQIKYNLMVLNVLKELSKTENVRLSIREIARIVKINPMAVSRAINKLEPILDVKRGSDFESFRLPLTLVRLKGEVKNSSIEELVKKVKMSNKFLEGIYGR